MFLVYDMGLPLQSVTYFQFKFLIDNFYSKLRIEIIFINRFFVKDCVMIFGVVRISYSREITRVTYAYLGTLTLMNIDNTD